MGDKKRLIALNINFDSLAECLKLSGIEVDSTFFVDPCFFAIMDRFNRIVSEYNAPLSIYLIGKDLLASQHRNQVKKWSEKGHEIGNHSWSHPQSLSNMSSEDIRLEVKQAHDIISETIGHPPKGFIAPAWSTSPQLIQILIELGYKYDTSSIPSWVQLAVLAKLKMKSKFHNIPLFRKDFMSFFKGCTQPYLATPENPWQPNLHGLAVLPLPTSQFRIPIWHTMSFLMLQPVFDYFFRHSIEQSKVFYYLMHPLDLLDPKVDLPGLSKDISAIERINIPIEKKEALLRHSLDILSREGEFVTMDELSRHIFYEK